MKRRMMIAALLATFGATALGAQGLAPAKEITSDPAAAGRSVDRIERITADLSGAIGEWTGVRSCGDDERALQARKAAYERWIGQETLARPRKVLLSAGVGDAKWGYQNRRRNNARSCKGWYSAAPAYANFY